MAMVSSLANLSEHRKQELVASLSVLVVGDDATAESLRAVATASGNRLSDAWAFLFASVVSKSGGIDKFCASPGSGGGGVDATTAREEEAEAVPEKEEEAEEEMDLGGGIDMFGGEEGEGGGDY